jgi:hypothetical protein
MTDTSILGKQVLPLPIKKGLIQGPEADRVNGGMGAWLTGDKRREHYRRAVERAECEYNEESVNQDWFVYSIHANGTVMLRSEYGYDRDGIDMDEFEVIKDGKTWGE